MKYEYIVSGAGFISLILCLILKKNNKSFVVFDKISHNLALKDDKKTLAISKFSMNILTNLGVINKDHSSVSPIKNIFIYEDKKTNPNQDFCIFEDNNEPLGYMIDSYILKKKLIEKIGEENVLWSTEYIDFRFGENGENIFLLKNNQEIRSDYLFISEGKDSIFHEFCDIRSYEYKYNQTALLFKIKHQNEHNYSALEKFFHDSMIAILPLENQNESSIVWIVKNKDLDLINNLNSLKFLELLNKKIDYSLGEIYSLNSSVIDIKKYDLKLKFLEKINHKNVFFIGDSAHSIHPVAGQGLNLSISDLIRILKYLNLNSFSNNIFEKNIFNLDILKNKSFFNIYSMFFNLQMIGFTHILNPLFLNKNNFLAPLRNKAISIFQDLKILNSFLKNNATGEKFLK